MRVRSRYEVLHIIGEGLLKPFNRGFYGCWTEIRSEVRFSGRSDPWFACPRVQIP